jgi:hypothetical protein
MAYNVVSSAAWWMKNRLAGRLLDFVTDDGNFRWHTITGQETGCSDWNGLEPFDLLRGWKDPEEYPDEKN